jgi:hypothetical protein
VVPRRNVVDGLVVSVRLVSHRLPPRFGSLHKHRLTMTNGDDFAMNLRCMWGSRRDTTPLLAGIYVLSRKGVALHLKIIWCAPPLPEVSPQPTSNLQRERAHTCEDSGMIR